jgi:hypothetical protein
MPDNRGAPEGTIEAGQVGVQIAETWAPVDAAQEELGRDVLFQIERVEQPLLCAR